MLLESNIDQRGLYALYRACNRYIFKSTSTAMFDFHFYLHRKINDDKYNNDNNPSVYFPHIYYYSSG